MRARMPDSAGVVERQGVQVHYEVFGAGGRPAVLLMPTWSVIHSRTWKMQVPFLARHYRVITYDGRGNGLSGRPEGSDSYLSGEFAADALAVMDVTGTDRVAVVSLSRGASYALHLGAASPDRVTGQVFICPTTPLAPAVPERQPFLKRFDEQLDSQEGWAKDNARYWERDYRGFLEFFFARVFSEPHSTKPIEDAVSWGLETTAATLADTRRGAIREAGVSVAAELAAVSCPCLVIQGTEDAIVGPDAGRSLAAALGERAALVELAGSGHSPHVRDPVKVNLLIRDFLDSLGGAVPAEPQRWSTGRSRPKRVLYVSSPIGLGHARRDHAIAAELRRLHPDVEIDWLAQHPVTAFLSARGSGSTLPRASSPASPATSSRSAPTMTCTASRPGGGWTRSCWPTSWSSATWSTRITTTCGSATKHGNSTITCTKTRSASERLTRG